LEGLAVLESLGWYNRSFDALNDAIDHEGRFRRRPEVEAIYEACARAGHLVEFERAYRAVEAKRQEEADRQAAFDRLPKCRECRGRGDVECDMGHRHDCPACGGTGRA
jgi:DnaJ-class molecular chaperone